MFSLTRPRSILTLALAVGFALAAQAAQDDKKDSEKKSADNSRRVSFNTLDKVELQGTFYPNPSGRKDACVLLLHNLDPKKGGSSHQDGWDHLAEQLQKDGYTVLSFDFRGHGDSKTIGPEFWDFRRYPHNQMLRGAKLAKPPTTIDQKDFSPDYFPYLVNDIAAAKAFLDRKNDAREVNSSNLIVIGAGEGATLGAMWMATEWKRKRVLPGTLDLGEPEGKDQVCAVWLSMGPSVGGRKILPLHNMIKEIGGENKVPMAFVYGKEDEKSRTFAQAMKDAITSTPAFKKDNKLKEYSGVEAIENTKLVGSQLLNKDLPTEKWIIDKYLDPVLEKKTTREWVKRDTSKFRYVYVLPSKQQIFAKMENEEMLRLVPPILLTGQ